MGGVAQVDPQSHLLFLELTGAYLQALDTYVISHSGVTPPHTSMADSLPLRLTLYDTSPVKPVMSCAPNMLSGLPLLSLINPKYLPLLLIPISSAGL